MRIPESEALESTVPLPPKHYMELVSGGNKDDLTTHFLSVGKRLVEALHEHGLINSTTRILDIGCGCGRVARFLVDDNLAAYTGFDRHRGMIEWCQEEIGARRNAFNFHYFDIKSSYQSMDGLEGSIDATRFAFPYDSGSFETALLSSVFTHMPLDESQRYLCELSRTLTPGGKVLLSVFLTGKEPYVEDINYYYNPPDFLRAVDSSGLRMTDDQRAQLTTGDGLGLDNWQHNWFIFQK